VFVLDAELDPSDRTLITFVARCRGAARPVAVLFCGPDPIAAAQWIELGASAVLTHDASLIEIADTIDRLHRQEVVLGVSVREGLLSRLRAKRQADLDRSALFATLTKREAQVLRELAHGATPEEVARASFVSLNTVRTQIRGILAKLGVTSVVSAVAMAYRTGWMPADLV
jgi:two-component system, NarL family, nitrate/nitrite response regulator NarL